MEKAIVRVPLISIAIIILRGTTRAESVTSSPVRKQLAKPSLKNGECAPNITHVACTIDSYTSQRQTDCIRRGALNAYQQKTMQR